MNFIFYEDEEKFINSYEKVVAKLMGNSKLDYKIQKITHYDENTLDLLNHIMGNKIYIFDVEVPGINGIDLARKIRKSGDWISPIIIVTLHEEFKVVGFTGKILMLDFISKSTNLENDLTETLKVALEITECRPSFDFSYKGDYFSLPYEDILYIEKNLNDNSSIVVCEDNDYPVRKTIMDIEQELDDKHFLKTHRSCIVNLKKIIKVDYDAGIIYFKDDGINLLSRNHKKVLKEKMKEIYGNNI